MALEDFRALDLTRHAHEPQLGRVWELRRNLSAYDAVYLALAEALDSRLVTCDARLARAPGITARGMCSRLVPGVPRVPGPTDGVCQQPVTRVPLRTRAEISQPF